MIQHTLILTTPRIEIPSVNIIEFAKELIAANLTNIDYFGIELDNGEDYINEEMQAKVESSTFLTFHFTANEIYYNILNEDSVLNLLFKLLITNEIGQVVVNEKDIQIYITESLLLLP